MSICLLPNDCKLTYMELRDRIIQILSDLGVTPQVFADRIGVSRPTVVMWKNGDTRAIKSEHAFSIEDAYGYSARWVAHGKGEKLFCDAHQTINRDPLSLALADRIIALPKPLRHAVVAIIEAQEVAADELNMSPGLRKALEDVESIADQVAITASAKSKSQKK